MKAQNSNGHSCCSPKNQSAESSSDFAKDPVCGMQVDKNSKLHSDYHGIQYYFCNAKCLDKFEGEPERFLSSKKSETQLQQEGIN